MLCLSCTFVPTRVDQHLMDFVEIFKPGETWCNTWLLQNLVKRGTGKARSCVIEKTPEQFSFHLRHIRRLPMNVMLSSYPCGLLSPVIIHHVYWIGSQSFF